MATKAAMAENAPSVTSVFEDIVHAIGFLCKGMGLAINPIKVLSNSKTGLDAEVQQLCEILATFLSTAFVDKKAHEIQQYLESRENTELHIAVTGEAGSGKSSFINAMRGLKAGDPGAARVGVTETTLKPTCYKYPNDPTVTLWDLPGMGSINFQSANYYEEVDFDRYDFFIILGSKRFQEIHINLAERIEKKMKKFYFVRSKVDEDLRNMKRDYPGTKDQDILKRIRVDCDTYFKIYIGDSSPRVFLISSYNLNDFDFDALMRAVEADLPRLKKLKFLLSLPNISTDIIEQKKVILKGELWKISLVSASIHTVPVPDISAAVDATFLQKYMDSVYKTFGLDDNSLALLARHINKPVEELKAHIQVSSPNERTDISNIIRKFLDLWGAHIFLLFKLSLLALVSTSLANAVLSYIVTYRMLSEFLDEVAEDAKRVSELARESIWQ